MDKLNRWRWILLYAALLSAIISTVFSSFSEGEVGEITTGIISFAFGSALTILFLIKPKTIDSRFKIALFILLGVGAFFWFLTYADHPGGEFLRKVWWTLDLLGMILSICAAFLLLFIFLARTIILIPLFIIGIIIGLVLNRLGADSEGGYFIHLGFLFLSIICLKEAITSLGLYRKKLFRRRLFFISCVLLCICNTLFFLQFVSYELSNFGIFDILQTIVFLITILILFIAMPFSNYLEWSKITRIRFKRLILLPAILIYLLLAVRFVLPTETYRKLLFKEHAGTEIQFGMKDYEIKDPE